MGLDANGRKPTCPDGQWCRFRGVIANFIDVAKSIDDTDKKMLYHYGGITAEQCVSLSVEYAEWVKGKVIGNINEVYDYVRVHRFLVTCGGFDVD